MRWPILRDVSLFLGGMAGVLHETLLSHSERPTLLILFAAMMGLPAFLQGGEGSNTASERIMRPHSRATQKRQRIETREREAQDEIEQAEITAEVERVLRARREAR
jgi:hypothetical protein